MFYKYISIPSDNSFDRSTPVYGVKVNLDNTGGSFSVDYFAYNFDLSAPASSSNFYQSGDEGGNFVIKVWSHYVKNNNNSAEVKDKNDVCTFFEGDTQIASVFNSVGTDVYEISFCQPLYLRNIGYFNSTIEEARARGRIELLVEDTAQIRATASKTTLRSGGETINIVVECNDSWTVTGNTFLTLSSTGDTSGTTITATAPSYSGATDRTDTLTFENTVTGYEAELVIKQRKYSSGQPVYLGGNEVTELYLGGNAVSEAYLGDVLVFSTGPFVGLKVSPNTLYFNSSNLTASIKVKASESWTITTPAWTTASTLTGDTGETIVTLTATTQTAATSGTIVVTSANYSASTTANYAMFTPVNYIHSQNMVNNCQDYITLPVNCTVNSKVRIVGKGAGYNTGWILLGNGLGDQSGDWRWFGTGPTMIYLDINKNRLNNSGINYNPFGRYNDFDFTIGNHYWTAEYNGQTYNVDGVHQDNVTSQPFILIMGVLWISAVQIWEGETLVFDGSAGKLGNEYGLFDSISGQLITSTDFNIVGEE